jgi:hypothetical protein
MLNALKRDRRTGEVYIDNTISNCLRLRSANNATRALSEMPDTRTAGFAQKV